MAGVPPNCKVVLGGLGVSRLPRFHVDISGISEHCRSQNPFESRTSERERERERERVGLDGLARGGGPVRGRGRCPRLR
jgi:hypothetical protein